MNVRNRWRKAVPVALVACELPYAADSICPHCLVILVILKSRVSTNSLLGGVLAWQR